MDISVYYFQFLGGFLVLKKMDVYHLIVILYKRYVTIKPGETKMANMS